MLSTAISYGRGIRIKPPPPLADAALTDDRCRLAAAALLCVAATATRVEAADWQEAMFSKDTYRGKKSATGQPVFGSFTNST